MKKRIQQTLHIATAALSVAAPLGVSPIYVGLALAAISLAYLALDELG